ncbi:MAG: Hpt domain-containing protein [Dokdonella sp.]
MKLQQDIDFNGLGWIKGEIDATLKQAQEALEGFVEDTADTGLMRFCAAYLHQVQGALRMVELYGAAMVADEMELLAQAIVDGRIHAPDDAYAVLLRGIVQLPNYLERVQEGHKDVPVVLLPLLNDLRACRGEKLLSESVLFSTGKLDEPTRVHAAEPPDVAPAAAPLGRIRKLREAYEFTLLRWFKAPTSGEHLTRLIAILDRLYSLSMQPEARSLWRVGTAVLEAIRDGALEASVTVKLLFGQIDREFKRFAEEGENSLAAKPPREVMQSLLYYIAHSSADGPRVSEVRRIYHLQAALPTDGEMQQAEGAMAGHNRTLLNTVSNAIKDDLLRVKEMLDMFLRTRDADPAMLLEPAESLDRVGDTLGMLGLGIPRRMIEEQRLIIEEMSSGRSSLDEPRLLDVAKALLVVETTLDDHIDRLGSEADLSLPLPGELELPKAEVRKILDALMREAASNVQQVKFDIVAFIESPWDHARVEPIPRLLEEIAGALNMLDLGDAAEAMTGILRFVDGELLRRHVVPSATQMDHLADALASIEYYLDATREQRAGREQILLVTQRALADLGYWPVPASERPSEAAGQALSVGNVKGEGEKKAISEHELLRAAPVPGWLGDIDGVAAPSDVVLPSRVRPLPASPPSAFTQYGFVGDDEGGIDHEIREVYLEEVDDEIAALRSALAVWLQAPDQSSLLVPIRRSFHTLKGSGRLVGAGAIAEFSWKIESVFNRVLEGSIAAGPDVQAFAKDAVAMLPALAVALRSGVAPGEDVEDLMQRAHELANVEFARAPLQREATLVASDSASRQGEDAKPDVVSNQPDIDPALLEILTTEMAMHGAVIDSYLADCSPVPLPVTDDLLRAVHTLNGAVAMVEVPALSSVLGPAEGYLRRMHGGGLVPDGPGLMALHRIADLVRQVRENLGSESVLPAEPAGLASRLAEMRDAMPEPSNAQQYGDDAATDDFGEVIEESTDIGFDFSSEFGEDSLGDSFAYDGVVAAEDDIDDVLKLDIEGDAPSTGAALSSLPGVTLDDNGFPESPAPTEPPKIIEPESAAESAPAPIISVEASVPDPARDMPEIDEELLEVFLQEAGELLDHCDGVMADLHQNPDSPDGLSALQRDLHTLKGGARMAGLVPIGDLGHAMETLLERVQDGHRQFDGQAVEALQHGFDTLHQMVQRVAQHAPIAMPIQALARLERGSNRPFELPAAPLAGASVQAEADSEAAVEVTTDTAASEPVGDEMVPSEDTPIAEETVEESVTPEKADDMAQEVSPPAPRSPSATVVPIKPLPPPSHVAAAPAMPAMTRPPDAVVAADEVPRTQEMIRVRSDLLDSLVNFAGEVSIYRSRLDQQNASFRFNLVEFDQTITRLRDQLRKFEMETEMQIVSRYEREQGDGQAEAKPVFDPLELDRFSQLQQYSRSLAESVSDLVSIQNLLEELTRQSEALLLSQARVGSELQEGLMRTRMVPFDSLVPTLRRTLRQAAQDVGKRAQLKVEGAQGEMDRNLLERMKAPFEHMLRNALAHAIETPEERVQAGKPDEGTVTIAVSRDATEVVLRVSDDGRGLDADAIRRRAIERGLMKPDQVLADRDIYPFILESGFSTSTEVTKLAGRGVGMDVVHNEIKQLGGSLTIASRRGEGTDFSIRLPFTLAVTQAIVVTLGNATYAVPMTSVQGVSRIERDELQQRIGSATPQFPYSGEQYDIYDLANLLDIPPERAPDDLQLPLLMTRTGDQRAAVRVDSVTGSREVVVKSVGPQVSSVPGIFGATIMGDGSVVMILDLAPLVRRAAAKRVHMEASAIIESLQLREIADDDAGERPALVMVVDDSITMRKVTQRVLERADLEVITAKDGVDAVEKLQERTPDLMLLDIEMPRMDGYELASYMKNDARLRNVPIMMITSRSGEKHRQRAMEIGVERYLGKPYQESDLLRQVQEMLEVERG